VWNVALAGVPFGLSVVSINIGKHIDKMRDDKGKGVGTLPVRLGETASRYINIAVLVLIYLVIVYLIFVPRYFTPVMLIVFQRGSAWSRPLGCSPNPVRRQRRKAIQPGRLGSRLSPFSTTVRSVGLFILGLIVDTILRLVVSGFWPLR